MEASLAELLEHALRVVLLRSSLHELNGLLTVGTERVLVAVGVVEELPVEVDTGVLGVLLALLAVGEVDGSKDLLVLGGLGGEEDHPHDGGLVGDAVLKTEDVAAVVLADLDHVRSDGLELEDHLEVGAGGSLLHLGDNRLETVRHESKLVLVVLDETGRPLRAVRFVSILVPQMLCMA